MPYLGRVATIDGSRGFQTHVVTHKSGNDPIQLAWMVKEVGQLGLDHIAN